MTLNQMNVNMSLKRIEICDLLIACTFVANETDAGKWEALHDKLEKILEDFDNEYFS